MDRYSFIDSISETAGIIKQFFADTTSGKVPKITVDMKSVNSKYNWGGNATVLDMSWYAPYKAFGDALLSAMIWIFFAWRVYVKLPSIINGTAGDINSVTRGFKE